jgi:nucleolar protein 58
VEERLKQCEQGVLRQISGSGKAKSRQEKYEHQSEVKTYNPSTDSTISPGAVSGKRKRKAVDIEDGEELHQEEQLEQPVMKKSKKAKKEKRSIEPQDDVEENVHLDVDSGQKKKKKKKQSIEA